jgi:hypothetical protein
MELELELFNAAFMAFSRTKSTHAGARATMELTAM